MRKKKPTKRVLVVLGILIAICIILLVGFKMNLVDGLCSWRVSQLPANISSEIIYRADFPNDLEVSENVTWMNRSRLEKIKCEMNPFLLFKF
jgi:hypothetical protein